MIANIKAGNYNVMESNVIYLPDEKSDLVLDFKFEDDFRFALKLFFKTDNDNTGYKIEKKVRETNIEITCINFNNTLGVGTNEPLELAIIKGKKLYIHVWSFLFGDEINKTRKIEYTVLLER